jgi:hypothetical protein
MSQRFYCTLSPCIDAQVVRPDAYTGQSFATEDAYYRHMERGHLIARTDPACPSPYVVTRMDRYSEEVA